jgi:hypothetical protein
MRFRLLIIKLIIRNRTQRPRMPPGVQPEGGIGQPKGKKCATQARKWATQGPRNVESVRVVGWVAGGSEVILTFSGNALLCAALRVAAKHSTLRCESRLNVGVPPGPARQAGPPFELNKLSYHKSAANAGSLQVWGRFRATNFLQDQVSKPSRAVGGIDRKLKLPMRLQSGPFSRVSSLQSPASGLPFRCTQRRGGCRATMQRK